MWELDMGNEGRKAFRQKKLKQAHRRATWPNEGKSKSCYGTAKSLQYNVHMRKLNLLTVLRHLLLIMTLL